MSEKMRKQVAKVIPFKKSRGSPKIKTDGELFKAKYSGEIESGAIINLIEKRQEMRATDRRNVTRTVLSQFIGVFVVLPKAGLKPVSVYDISDGGLAFDLSIETGSFKSGDNVTMRIYLSHDTYFSFSVSVINARPSVSGARRHGVLFKKDDDSYKTLVFFSRFLQNVSVVARKDHGDRLLGNIE